MTIEIIEVSFSHGSKVRKQLFYLGFIELKNKYILETSDSETIENAKAFLISYHIAYLKYNSQMKRSNDYRKKYFEKNQPFIGKYYFCAYCGRPLIKEKVTVDHIVSIRKAQKSNVLQYLLNKKMSDINDDKNLVASCARCNQRKGQRISVAYMIRGFLGKRKWFWIIYYCTILMILFVIMRFLIH